jgi:hypothetical protein
MHGEISHQPARDVRVARWLEGDDVVLGASARVAEVSALGHHLELARTWTVARHRAAPTASLSARASRRAAGRAVRADEPDAEHRA